MCDAPYLHVRHTSSTEKAQTALMHRRLAAMVLDILIGRAINALFTVALKLARCRYIGLFCEFKASFADVKGSFADVEGSFDCRPQSCDVRTET